MYIPKHFLESRQELLHDLIRNNAFAPLITQLDGQFFASHLPFLFDPARGEHGALRSHMARANPQWRDLASAEALVIFQGPHAFVSPSWYIEKPAVPTWNYAVVHAYGSARLLDDVELRTLLQDTIGTFESPDTNLVLPEEYFDRMSRGVVGFEIAITRLEGKFKLSQNRSAADRASVIRALGASEKAADIETAALMASALAEDHGS